MKSRRSTTIQASELGTYLFCRRAWWYRRKGRESENLPEMRAGTQLHEQHGRAVLAAGLYRWAGYAILLLALALTAVYLVNLLVQLGASP